MTASSLVFLLVSLHLFSIQPRISLGVMALGAGSWLVGNLLWWLWFSVADVVVVSLHWGGNWGYEIPGDQERFARRLIETAGVDLIHGHSSHHVKGLEVYRDRLILYGCGDFLNDYEGIEGFENYRGDLSPL